MGRPNLPDTGPDTPDQDGTDLTDDRSIAPDGTDPGTSPPSELAEIYGCPVPDTALLLERYLEHGRVPVRDPEHPQDVVTVDLPVAAHEFGSNLDATCHYLHRLHATGGLTVAPDGTVEFGPALSMG